VSNSSVGYRQYRGQDNGQDQIVGEFPTNITPNAWHHLAVVVNTETLTNYYDSAPVTTPFSPATFTLLDTSGQSLALGGANGGYFHGSLDAVRIYTRPLTQPEIRELYHEGMPQ